MEVKKAPPKASASLALLGEADKQISLLTLKVLPSIPHLLSVPTNNPYMPNFPYEHKNIPFARREEQYVTLISTGDRGVGHTAANWQDDTNSSPPLSAGAQSSSGTPSIHRDPKKPAVKISLSDYKNKKTTGHARNTSSTSIDTPMARIPSLEGENKRNGAEAQVKVEHRAPIPSERPGQSRAPHTDRDEKMRETVNGRSPREPSQEVPSSKSGDRSSKEPLKIPLPPRPQSPRRVLEPPRQQKRSHDTLDVPHPEKRVKGERGEVRIPSNGHSSVARKPESLSLLKSSPSQKPSASRPLTPTPPKKAAAISSHQGESRKSASKSTEKPLKIPKILSPLPDDLIPYESDEPGAKIIVMDKATPPTSHSLGASPNTIVVKTSRTSSSSRHPPSKLSDDMSPPESLRPDLPRMLSPGLPDPIEAELQRLQEKALNNSLNTIEARHEKVRQPGAVGVARKTQRPKVGHPPKKIRSNSPRVELHDEEPPTQIVKLRYKKRNVIAVQRILALPPKSVREREAAGRIRERSRSAVPPPGDTSDSEDMPIAAKRAAKAPAGTTGQKRPSGLSDAKEPAAKRPKVPEVTSALKTTAASTPALKSSAPTKEKGQLLTPKKGDTIKSITMRKVDSSEGHAHTPQAGNLSSTPASAEKSRINGLTPQVVSQELARASQEHSKFFPLGTTLKRRMDNIMKNSDVPENIRKTGIMHGIEALLCYMLAFHAGDKATKFRNQAPQPENWAQFFPVWIFMEHKTAQYPELHALVDQLGAVSREQLNKASVEQPADKRDWDKMISNLKERDRLWMQCKRNEQLILGLGVTGTLGPWSSVSEAVGFGVATLTCYAERQGDLEWKQEPNLTSSYTRKFMGDDA